MPEPLHIIYQGYGGAAFRDQACFSALTCRHFLRGVARDIRIVIYTDRPEEFPAGEWRFETLDAKRVAAWRGRYGFVHRLKIELIRDAAQRFGTSLLYLDGDTYWTASPGRCAEHIEAGDCVMHLSEGRLSPRNAPYLHQFLLQEQAAGRGTIVPDVEVWNAGVIGLPAQHLGLLDEVLALTDNLFRRCYQREWLEQLAFSHVLQQHARVVGAQNEIAHYWNRNSETPPALRQFFESNAGIGLDELAARAAAFDLRAHTPPPDRSPRGRYAHAMRKLRRSWRKRLVHWRVAWDNRLERQ